VSDGVQPGTKIDEELWERFREDVKRRRGGVRGHIRTELENALRAYIHGGDATPTDIDARLQRIEAELGIAPADGGVAPSEDGSTHTRAPSRIDAATSEKPPANAATEKKIAYLAACVAERFDGIDEGTEFPPAVLQNIVKEEYGFRADTAKRYVDELIDHFGFCDHPHPEVNNLVSEARHDELLSDLAEPTDSEEADR